MADKISNLILLLVLVIISGCQIQQPVDNAVLSKTHASPFDNTIAFSRLTGDYWQVWTMQPDGSNLKQVTKSLSDKRYPVWKRDGRELFCRTNNNKAFSVNPDSGSEHQIIPSMALVGGIASSPIDDKLLLVRFRTQLRDSASLWLTTLDEKNSRILTRDTGLQYDPAWSYDGEKIAYILGHGYQTHELYIMDCTGKNKRKLTNNKALEVLPAFSPDGKTIAYASDITGDFEIWLMNVYGSNCRQLTNSKGLDTRPYWSPDGNKIMFVSNRSGKLQIWIMNNDGSNPEQLTTGAASIDPAWRRE